MGRQLRVLVCAGHPLESTHATARYDKHTVNKTHARKRDPSRKIKTIAGV
jgi:hypothetical protein